MVHGMTTGYQLFRQPRALRINQVCEPGYRLLSAEAVRVPVFAPGQTRKHQLAALRRCPSRAVLTFDRGFPAESAASALPSSSAYPEEAEEAEEEKLKGPPQSFQC